MSYAWLLNPETWDVMIGPDGKFAKVSGANEVLQRISVALNHFWQEYFLNVNAGLPWYNDPALMLGAKDVSMSKLLIQAVVLGVPGVISLVSMQLAGPNAANKRRMSLSMVVEVQGAAGAEIADIVYNLIPRA